MSGILAQFIRPSAVREGIERDCREIEHLLDVLARAALQLRKHLGKHRVGKHRADLDGTVRRQCKALRDRLRRHSDLERAVLVPILRAADPWGEQRAQALIDRLNRRREDLDALFGVDDERLPPIGQLVDYVRHDLELERKQILHSELLRDDVIGIDVQTG